MKIARKNIWLTQRAGSAREAPFQRAGSGRNSSDRTPGSGRGKEGGSGRGKEGREGSGRKPGEHLKARRLLLDPGRPGNLSINQLANQSIMLVLLC